VALAQAITVLLTRVKRRLKVPFQLLRMEARLIRVVKPDRRLAVFGSAKNGFGDNAAHLFRVMSPESEIRCVWVSGSRQLVARLKGEGFQAEYRWSLTGVLTAIRAGWVVVNFYTRDVHVVLGRGAVVLNLWHGLPLKRIGHDFTGQIVHDDDSRWFGSLVRSATTDLRPPDFVLSTTPRVSTHFSTAFRLAEGQCLEFGYPRCDPLFHDSRPPDPLLVHSLDMWQRLRDARFVVGYFPTWRDDGRDFISVSGLSLRELAETVRDEGGLFVCKLHPHTVRTSDTGGVQLLDGDDDASAFLNLCSILITDYSSVAFDFLLLDRPLIYYVPDLDDYRETRGFYYSIEEAMPGPLIREPAELLRSVQETIRSGFRVSDRASAVRTLFWGDYCGGASRKIADFMRDWSS
jgi:CDP-glycerol glycerophosphotransferase (TagB/SpsB family)